MNTKEYELWDGDSYNLVGFYTSLEEAINDVRKSIALYGFYEATRDLLLIGPGIIMNNFYGLDGD